jgi:hypothetical protein
MSLWNYKDMSSLSAIDEDQAWERLDRIIASIPHEGNRVAVRRYVEERRANGIKMSTLGIDVNALRGFCEYLGPKAVEDVGRQDIVSYVNNAKTVVSWRNRSKDGRETVTTKAKRLGARTLRSGRRSCGRSSAGCAGRRTTRLRSRG